MKTIAIDEIDSGKIYTVELDDNALCDVKLVYGDDPDIPNFGYVMQNGDGGTVYSQDSIKCGDSIGCVENYGFSEDAIVQFVLMTL